MLAGALPANKMGYYMGVFNFFIVLPQMVAGVTLGFLHQARLWQQPVLTLVLGGAAMILSGLLTLRVHDADDIRLPNDMTPAENLAYDVLASANPKV
ncbi:MAG: hypothetical protein WKG07_28820 [Hymenobacter sp.]